LEERNAPYPTRRKRMEGDKTVPHKKEREFISAFFDSTTEGEGKGRESPTDSLRIGGARRRQKKDRHPTGQEKPSEFGGA